MNKTRALSVVAATTVMALLVASSALGTVKLPTAGTAAQVKKLVAAAPSITKLSATMQKELSTAAADNPGKLYPQTYNGCTTLTQCVFGDKKATKVLVALGDSHAQMWVPALNRIGTSHKLKVILLFLAQCPAASLAVWSTFTNSAYPQCSTQRAAWITELNALHPVAIVLAERTYGIYSAASNGTLTFTDAQWQAGLETTILDLKASKAKIAVLGDIVTFDAAVPACLTAFPSSIQSCSAPNPNPARDFHQSAEAAAAKAEGSLFVNPMPWLCTKTCSPVIGSYIAYYDQYHISCVYAAYLSGVLQTALKKIL